MGDNTRELYWFVRVGGENLKGEWWNEEFKLAPDKKVTAGKDVLEAMEDIVKKSCMEIYKEEKRSIITCKCQSEMEANEEFGRKVNNIYV